MNTESELKPTSWLVQRLNISKTTIQRLRSLGSSDLPPCVKMGRSIRYDVAAVEEWLAQRLITKTPEMTTD